MMQKIVIHSAPRSGSTWLGNIFNSHPDVLYKYQPLFSYAFKDYLNPKSSAKEIDIFFDLITHSEDAFINQKHGIDKGIIPSFYKSKSSTHICYKEVRYHHILRNLIDKDKEIKFIFIIRNPLAVLYSWKNTVNEFRNIPDWDFNAEWLDAPSKNCLSPEEYNGFNRWKEASLIFNKLKLLNPNAVLIVEYSDLMKNTMDVVKQVFEFSDLYVTDETKSFICKSKTTHQNDPYSVYKIKNIDEQWKELPQDVINYVIQDLKGTDLERYIN